MKVKLIRDRGPLKVGKKEGYANAELYRSLLLNKIHEEAEEVARDPKDVFEYADVLEVLQTIALVNQIDWNDVIEAQAQKKKERGGFTAGRYFVDEGTNAAS